MEPVVRHHTHAGDRCAAVRRRPARGVGAAHLAAAQYDLLGGPRSSVGRGGRRMAAGSPGAPGGVERGCVLAHPGAPPPPPRAPRRQRARSQEIHTGGCDAATI